MFTLSRILSYLIVGALLLGGCDGKQDPPASHDGHGHRSPTQQPASAEAIGPDTSPVPIDLSKGWCAGHGVPESVCSRCDSDLIARFKQAGDWCQEHGLPESQCELCHPGVMARWAAVQTRGAANEIHRAASPRTPPSALAGAIRLEPRPPSWRPANDSQCRVDTLRVRFVDPSIVEKAGIRTDAAARRRISATVDLPAEVQFDETRVTHVTPRVGGVVIRAPVGLGESVSVGDVLAVIESAELGEARSRYIERRENHALAERDLARVRAIFEGTQHLLRVCTAEASMEELRKELADVRVGDAKSRLLRAHAAMALARSTEARERQLLERKISSQQDHDRVRSEMLAAEAEFLALREEIAFTSERTRLGAERELQVARSALEAAERQLRIIAGGVDGVDEGGVAQSECLSHYELRSPVGGRVIQRHLTVGEAVDVKETVLTVADPTSMWLVMAARERDLAELRVGLPVVLTVDGLTGRSFTGRLTWIASALDEGTRSLRVRAELHDDSGMLKAGMFGTARVVLHENEEVLTVPEAAVQTDGCCQLLFVRREDTVFEPRRVLLGSSTNGFVEVIQGLTEGEQVATTGSFLMKTEVLKTNIGAGCCEVDPGR